MFFPKLKLTDVGRALLSEVIAGGGTLNFSGMALGDGELPAGEDGTHLTALIHQIGAVPISAITTGDGGASLTASLDTTQLIDAVTGRELGIYADDLEGGDPILYAYSNAGDLATYIPKGSGDTYQRITLNVVVAVGDAEEVTATIGGITGYATTEQLDEHKNDNTNPHHVTKAQIGLGNVENVTINNQTPTYTEPNTLQALVSGETLRVALGKLSYAVKSLIAHIGNRSNPHGVTAAQIGAADADHSHIASSVSETTGRKWMTPAERTKLAGIADVEVIIKPKAMASGDGLVWYLEDAEQEKLMAAIIDGKIPVLLCNRGSEYSTSLPSDFAVRYVGLHQSTTSALFFEIALNSAVFNKIRIWQVDLTTGSIYING